jgi:hypothetical protein
MNGKGRLIVAKNGKYSHLTMLSQISTRNREEIDSKSFHKKKLPSICSALPFATRSFPRFYLSTTQLSFLAPVTAPDPFPARLRASLLVTTRAVGNLWATDGRRQSACSRAYLSLFVISLTDTLPFAFRAAVPLSPAHLSRLSPQWIRYSRSSPSSSFK